jgi:flavin reductase (DIM6/NTAB) family NADH-FMN oxidoreductase RutF
MALECTIEEIYPGGDHGIVLARVCQIHRGNEEAGPLLFYKGKVMSLGGPETLSAVAQGAAG